MIWGYPGPYFWKHPYILSSRHGLHVQVIQHCLYDFQAFLGDVLQQPCVSKEYYGCKCKWKYWKAGKIQQIYWPNATVSWAWNHWTRSNLTSYSSIPRWAAGAASEKIMCFCTCLLQNLLSMKNSSKILFGWCFLMSSLVLEKLRILTLPETNIAIENPPFWWYLQGNMGIFMGYVSFREGNDLIGGVFSFQKMTGTISWVTRGWRDSTRGWRDSTRGWRDSTRGWRDSTSHWWKLLRLLRLLRHPHGSVKRKDEMLQICSCRKKGSFQWGGWWISEWCRLKTRFYATVQLLGCPRKLVKG